MSQADQILEYMIMIPGRRISTWIAYELFHCTTICQRIPDIRKKLEAHPLILNGIQYEVKDELVTRNGKTFSEYWIEPVEQEQMELKL